jgi:hypothetical protein
MSTVLLDAAGRRRSPATMPGFHTGRPPRNKGRRYPADPPKVEEILAVMRQAGMTPHGLRMRGLIVVLWRAGLRIHEALALSEADLDAPLRCGPRAPRQGWPAPRSRDGRLGLRTTPAVAGRPRRAPRRPAVLHPDRTDPRPRMVAGRGPRAIAPHSGACWCPAAVRSAPAPSRPRRRDGARGCPADRLQRQPRTYQPRHHLDLPAGIDSAEIVDTVHARRPPVVVSHVLRSRIHVCDAYAKGC